MIVTPQNCALCSSYWQKAMWCVSSASVREQELIPEKTICTGNGTPIPGSLMSTMVSGSSFKRGINDKSSNLLRFNHQVVQFLAVLVQPRSHKMQLVNPDSLAHTVSDVGRCKRMVS